MKNLLISSDIYLSEFLKIFAKKKNLNLEFTDNFNFNPVDFSLLIFDTCNHEYALNFNQKIIDFPDIINSIFIIDDFSDLELIQNKTLFEKDEKLLPKIIEIIELKSRQEYKLNFHTENQIIYIADDSKVIRNSVKNILEKEKIIVETFENGNYLLQKLKNNTLPDLILLDNEMPEKDGIETLTEIKNNVIFSEIPIIFLSGITDKSKIVKALELGAADYITKPFDNNELIARINIHLKINWMKNELIKNNDKIKNQYEEINQQSTKLQKTNQLIETRNKKITASIQYAKNIQAALLPELNELSNFCKDYFIYFKPKDIVSGDFYWYKSINDKFIISLADCTGHGVPGAFMTSLGITLLNEIIANSDSQNIHSDIILNSLRDSIKNSFNKINNNIIKDGMDIALCIFDFKKKQFEFSGANSSVFLITNDISLNQKNNYENIHIHQNQDLDSNLLHIKGDKMPIGYFLKEKPFSKCVINFESGNYLYFATDGFPDQMRKVTFRRFTSKRLIYFFIENYKFSFEKQFQLLEECIFDWKENMDQTDDITIIGLKL